MDEHWARVVMNRETAELIRSLDFDSLSALEVSGRRWEDFGFASYEAAEYPDYDLCEGPFARDAFDVVLVEQVLEHVLWPYRAVRNVWEMLRPGGHALVTTPFMIRIHDGPEDCSRWTETGMKHLLAEGGFELSDILTGSWGNRACVRANFEGWARWVRWRHTLRNEPQFPMMVWALARKS